MVPFAGRCPARQYLPSKPDPLGLKIFVLASKDGAMLDFVVYQGKGTFNEEDMKNFGVGGAVVKRLVESVPRGKPVYLFTDRYFTGIKIADFLRMEKIYLTGTVMSNRTDGVGNKLQPDRKMKKGDWDEWVREDGNICILKWKDNKGVILASSAFGSAPATTCLRWSSEEKKKIEVPQPAIVNQYNSSMGGVDLLDRFIAYYRISTKTRKWPLRVFSHFIDAAVVNCWILYKRDCLSSGMRKKETMTLMEFRLYIAEALIRMHSNAEVSPKVGRPSKNVQTPLRHRQKENDPLFDVRCDGLNHFPENLKRKTSIKVQTRKMYRKESNQRKQM